jgi:hypothetical protein
MAEKISTTIAPSDGGTASPTGRTKASKMQRTIMLSLLMVMVIGLIISNLEPSMMKPVAIVIAALILISGIFATFKVWNISGRKVGKMRGDIVLPFIMIVLGAMILLAQLFG